MTYYSQWRGALEDRALQVNILINNELPLKLVGTLWLFLAMGHYGIDFTNADFLDYAVMITTSSRAMSKHT